MGDYVILTCTVDPIPPGPMSYQWSTSTPTSYYSISSQGPNNVSVYIELTHPKEGLYFCHVLSNGDEVAVGYTVIKPQGFLIPIGPTEVTYRYGDTIVLRVNISSFNVARNIQSLQWYRDGNPVPVNSSSDMRVYSDSVGTRLTIQRARRSDEGEYTVKIQSIQYLDNSNECQRGMLSLLERYYAVHSPVTFSISSSSSQVSYADASIYISTTKNIQFEKNVPDISQLGFLSCPCSYCRYTQPSLYFNGYQISDSRVAYTILNGSVIFNIQNATAKDFGVYELVSSLCSGSPGYIYNRCFSYYYIAIFNYFGTLRRMDRFTVVKYVPPKVSLQSWPKYIDQNTPSTIVITCAARNGTPDVHNITLIKSGSVIATTIGGNTLNYTVPDTMDGLGQYVCEVNSLYSTQQKSIVLRGSGYEVSVNILTNGPIALGDYVSLTCTAHPIPPGPVSYQWSTSIPGSYISSQGPNATLYMGTAHPKQGLYFCHVLSNGGEVAVGHIVIKPQGFLIPIGPTKVTYHYGDTIVLGVDILSYYIAQTSIQSLQWYRDGSPVPVNSSSDMRVYSDSVGTRLTIQRAGMSDEGEYTVKIHTIYGVDNSNECHRGLLSLLEIYYAAHSPVTFTISSSSSQVLYDNASIYVNTTINIQFEKNVPDISQLGFLSCPCSYCRYTHPSLYFNGYQLSDNRVAYTIQPGSVIFNISNTTSKDFGVYEIVTLVCGGRPAYTRCLSWYYINIFNYFGYLYGVETFTVVKYVPPQVSFQALTTCTDPNTPPTIVITCAAHNGTPDVHNITLMKSGSVIASTMGGNTLNYTAPVTRDGLGQYVCEVNSLYSTQKKSLVLRGSAILQLDDYSNEQWTAEPIYSVQYGLVTTSDLVSMIQSWALEPSGGCIAIGGSTPQLSRGCCLNGTSFQKGQSSYDIQIAAGTIGGFVGGVLLTICIGAFVVIRIKKSDTDKNKITNAHGPVRKEMKDTTV